MKDECNGKIITEFIGLRSKMCSYFMDSDNNNDIICNKRNKGTSHNIIKRLHFEDYKNALNLSNILYDHMYTFKTSKHTIYTQVKRKKVLCGNDDKRCILSDKVNTLAWGHYKCEEINKE